MPEKSSEAVTVSTVESVGRIGFALRVTCVTIGGYWSRSSSADLLPTPSDSTYAAHRTMCLPTSIPPFGDGVRLRSLDGRLHHSDPFGPKHLVEGSGELGVAGADQETPCRPKPQPSRGCGLAA